MREVLGGRVRDGGGVCFPFSSLLLGLSHPFSYVYHRALSLPFRAVIPCCEVTIVLLCTGANRSSLQVVVA